MWKKSMDKSKWTTSKDEVKEVWFSIIALSLKSN